MPSQIQKDFQLSFTTETGQKVLVKLMDYCFFNQTTFVAGDPHQTAHNEGKRFVILEILKLMGKEHTPKQAVSDMEQAIYEYSEQPV